MHVLAPRNSKICRPAKPNSWASIETGPVADTEQRLGTPSQRQNPCFHHASSVHASPSRRLLAYDSRHGVGFRVRFRLQFSHTYRRCLPRTQKKCFFSLTFSVAFWPAVEIFSKRNALKAAEPTLLLLSCRWVCFVSGICHSLHYCCYCYYYYYYCYC